MTTTTTTITTTTTTTTTTIDKMTQIASMSGFFLCEFQAVLTYKKRGVLFFAGPYVCFGTSLCTSRQILKCTFACNSLKRPEHVPNKCGSTFKRHPHPGCLCWCRVKNTSVLRLSIIQKIPRRGLNSRAWLRDRQLFFPSTFKSNLWLKSKRQLKSKFRL